MNARHLGGNNTCTHLVFGRFSPEDIQEHATVFGGIVMQRVSMKDFTQCGWYRLSYRMTCMALRVKIKDCRKINISPNDQLVVRM